MGTVSHQSRGKRKIVLIPSLVSKKTATFRRGLTLIFFSKPTGVPFFIGVATVHLVCIDKLKIEARSFSGLAGPIPMIFASDQSSICGLWSENKK